MQRKIKGKKNKQISDKCCQSKAAYKILSLKLVILTVKTKIVKLSKYNKQQ